jgi:hypothetical protein
MVALNLFLDSNYATNFGKRPTNVLALEASASSWFSQHYFKAILILELLIAKNLRPNWSRFLHSILSAHLLDHLDFVCPDLVLVSLNSSRNVCSPFALQIAIIMLSIPAGSCEYLPTLIL